MDLLKESLSELLQHARGPSPSVQFQFDLLLEHEVDNGLCLSQICLCWVGIMLGYDPLIVKMIDILIQSPGDRLAQDLFIRKSPISDIVTEVSPQSWIPQYPRTRIKTH